MIDIAEAWDRLDAAEPFPYIVATDQELGPLITTSVRYDDLRAILGWVEDLEKRLSYLLDELTGGRLSKTGYDVRTMVLAIEENFERYANDDFAERLEVLADEYEAQKDGPYVPNIVGDWLRSKAGELREETDR